MDFNERLYKLKTRRSDLSVSTESAVFDTALNREQQEIEESYEKITDGDGVKYAIGAMAAVNRDYTKKSFEEGERVAKGLKADLEKHGVTVTHDFQGSVPLDIHIKGNSDVDVLVFHRGFVTYESPAIRTYYPLQDSKTVESRMSELRQLSEDELSSRYWAAKIDVDGAKSIALSGASLQRKVDIVPCHWHDTTAYQESDLKEDREVRVFDKNEYKMLGNWPFKFMEEVDRKDAAYNGSLKKICRLLKTLKADADKSRKEHLDELSSYDIASIVYHMGNGLQAHTYFDLALVAQAKDYLLNLSLNDTMKSSLMTPDNSRKIFDTSTKENGLMALTLEVSRLADAIYKEIASPQGVYDGAFLKNKEVVF